MFISDVDLAVESFGKLQTVDPYRLENMDTYSNLLYVKVHDSQCFFCCFRISKDPYNLKYNWKIFNVHSNSHFSYKILPA